MSKKDTKKGRIGRWLARKNKSRPIKINKNTDLNKGEKSSIRFSSKFSKINSTISGKFEAEWNNIHFDDGFIIVNINNIHFNKSIKESKKYINYVKHYYSFHKVPKLIIDIKEGEIKKIENEEILFYHISFLNVASSNFGYIEYQNFKLQNWRKYTNNFYRKKLAFAFQNDSLKLLCEYSYSSLPIIPVGESIINNRGRQEIHMSFLFPLKNNNGFFIVWESIVDSKASYVFRIKIYNDLELQNIYHFISGNIHNKRQTLIRSKALQTSLNFYKRILHNNLIEWNKEIKSLTNH